MEESWKCRKGKMVGYCPIPGLGRDREFSVMIGFFWPCATWIPVSRHGP